MDTLSALSQALGRVIKPLAERLSEGDQELAQLSRDLGYTALPAGPFAGLQSLCSTLLDTLASLEEAQAEYDAGAGSDSDLEIALGEVLAALTGVIAAIQTLPNALPPEARDFPERMYSYLLLRSLKDKLPVPYGLLLALGIFEDTVEGLPEQAVLYPQIRLERLPKLFQDPKGLFQDVYGWGTPNLDVDKLFDRLLQLSIVFGHPAAVEFPGDNLLQALGGSPASPSGEGAEPQLLVPIWANDTFSVSTALFPMPRAQASDPRALAATILASGQWNLDIALSKLLTLGIKTEVDLSSGIALVLDPVTGFALKDLTRGNPGALLKDAALELKLSYGDPASGGSTALLALGDGSGLFARETYLAIRATATGAGEAAFGFEGGVTGGKVKLALAGSDSFIGSILPKDGFEFDFDFILGWDQGRGLYFKGGGSIEVAIALHQALGPVTLEYLHLGLGIQDTGMKLGVGISLTLALGPIAATVENVGLNTLLGFQRGNLGPMDLGFAFKPPKGLGLVIDASVVKGGGYLMFDPDQGQYAGAVELTVQNQFSLTAIGILNTKFPDGSEGYSFLIIITAQFPPIGLGFNFWLNGVGGLLGLHRSMDTDRLRAGVQDNSVEGILFPKDVVKNIIRIISDLQAIFPVMKDQFVFGPMALISWSQPPIISVRLGVLLELTHPVRLVILGVLKAAVPPGDTPLVQIQVNFAGVIDFNAGYLTFDASLFDSFVGTQAFKFTLEGDMALRIFWGEQKEFLLTVGGFHPAFKPAANLKLGKIKRLTLSLLSGNPHLTLTTYFAITSNTVQFGAAIDFYFSIASFKVTGYFGFDVLFQFSPFYFMADIAARLAVELGDCTLFGIDLSFNLQGPAPWHARGKAEFKVLFFSYEVSFDKTFGENQDTSQPKISVRPQLVAALQESRNWLGELADTGFTTVSLRKGTDGESAVLLHGHGALSVKQNVMPLDTVIDWFGHEAPQDIRSASIGEIRIGAKSLTLAPTRDLFAPANFRHLSDDDKLKSPSFESMPNGVRASDGDSVWVTYSRNRSVEYEILVSDSAPDATGVIRKEPVSLGKAAMPADRFAPFVRGGGVGQSPLSLANRIRNRALDAKRVRTEPERFALASSLDLTRSAGPFHSGTRSEASDALQNTLREHPELNGLLQLVPEYAVEE